MSSRYGDEPIRSLAARDQAGLLTPGERAACDATPAIVMSMRVGGAGYDRGRSSAILCRSACLDKPGAGKASSRASAVGSAYSPPCAVARALFCVALSTAATTTHAQPSAPALDVVAVKADGAPLDVAISEVEVTPDTNLFTTLASRGMRVDGNVFALVFELNPGLVLPVRDDAQVRLPWLRDRGVLCSGACRGSVAAFINAKKQPIADLTALEQLASRVASQAASRFGDPVQGKLLRDRGAELSVTFHVLADALSGHKFPLSLRFVTQTARITSVYRQRLDRWLGGSNPLSREDLRWLIAASDDLESQLACCVTTVTAGQVPASSDIRVRVRTLRKGAEVPHLRVIAAPAGLADEADLQTPFPGQSSPTEDLLPAARYLIWAVEPDSSSPVSERLTVKVALGVQQPIDVDLELLKP